MTLDDARSAYPHLRFALYALDDTGIVTLEIMDPDEHLYSVKGRTEKECFDLAFPSTEPPTPPNLFD